MIEVKAPGKLYIAGEYAVVNPGNKAILISVDKFITVKLKKSEDTGSIKSYSNIKVIWSREEDKLRIEQEDDRFEYIISAINTVEKYLLEKRYKLDFYDIEVTSDLESKDGIKYGLGSSAAVVVAVIKAILEYYKLDYSKLDLFKLAAIASIKLNENGSCGDIASAVFNGLIKYTSFDREEIAERLKTESISHLLVSSWNSLDVEELQLNDNYNFVIGWTKSPASSFNLVKNAKKNLKNNIDFYKNFLIDSNRCVEDFVKAYITDNYDRLKEAIAENRKLLQKYAENFNITIEGDRLVDLIEIAIYFGLASKTSGAGGGDCGISIVKKDFDENILIEKWREKQISRLDLKVYEG